MIVFVVSFISPHTLPLGRALSQYAEVAFINTMPLTEERKKMGYDVCDERIKVYNYYENTNGCSEIINNAECVIFAGAFGFDILQQRLAENKLTYIMHERIFKKGVIKLLDPRTYELVRFCRRVRGRNVKLLSIGTKAAADFAFLGFPKSEIYKFGYFPEFESKIKPELSRDFCSIIWVGRMVDFKRPILALKAAKRLPKRYKLIMIGDGKLSEKAKRYAKKHNISVEFKDSLAHKDVMDNMLNSHILLSTSNKGEGWGAVVNEGMNSGCAIVCSDKIGCINSLAHSENACVFKSGSVSSLVRAIKSADESFDELSKKSIETIEEEYNPTVAAARLFALINEGKEAESGICSRIFK